MLNYILSYLNDKYYGSLLTSENHKLMRYDIDTIINHNDHLIKKENVTLEFDKQTGMMNIKVDDIFYQPEELI